MNSKCYVVMSLQGTYEDTTASPDKVFLNKQKADEYVKERNEYFKELEDRRRKITDDIWELEDDIFNSFLKETNPLFYEESQKAENGFPMDFDWEKYNKKHVDFFSEENTEGQEYIKKHLTIQQQTDLKTVLEYDRLEWGDTLPFLTVNEVDLISD